MFKYKYFSFFSEKSDDVLIISTPARKEVPIVTLGSSADEEDSILSSQCSDKELNSAWIRKRSIRRLKKLVDKCCRKRIQFPKKFCEISKRLAKVIHSFDLDLQVFIIILHHSRTVGIKIPLSHHSNNNSPMTYTLPIQ